MTIIGLFVKKYRNNIRHFVTNSKKLTSKCLHDISADQNKLSTIIGRDIEVRRCIDILCRKTKNNIILLGDPGVGKTAIVESLAQRILKGNVPDSLRDCRILSLDLGCLFSRSDDNTNIDTKLKNIISEIKNINGILFIDEAHLMLSKNYDWISVIKPQLSNGDIKCIAATTNAEYRKYFIRDRALQRRFQPLYIEEPNQSFTREILKSLKPSFEYFHNILISDNALESAVILSNRYIKDRFDPDKSIDLLDEACCVVKNRSQIPEFVDETNSDLSNSEFSQGRIKHEELKILIKSYYEAKRDELDAMKGGKLEDVGKLRFEVIPNLESRISAFMESNSGFREYFIVEPNDIANVLSKWLRVPISSIYLSNNQSLSVLRSRLLESFPDYSDKIEGLIASLYVSTMSERGISVIGIAGDNEIDKAEIIRIISDTLSTGLLDIDLSEYGEKHSLSRVIGPPPGYIGYEYGGQLSEMIKGSSTCIVMYNMDKCHSTIRSLLNGFIRKGYIRDSRGDVISLCNKCIIFNARNIEELNDFNAVINEVVEVVGSPSRAILERIISEFCELIEKGNGVVVLVDDLVIDDVRVNLDKLDKLKKYITRVVISLTKCKIIIGIESGEYNYKLINN